MPSDKTFHVVVFGLSEYEQRVLRTISILSRGRSRAYLLKEAAASDTADLAVVDSDDPQALAYWNAFQNNNPMVPAVTVGSHPPIESVDFHVDRPVMATHLLAVLDGVHISKEHPAFAPPKAYGTGSPRPTGHTTIRQQSLPKRSVAGFSALVVDDSLPIRKQMGLELKRYVGQVDFAENGKLGIWLVATRWYDIVFLDVVLPDMDGYQICRTIKRAKKTKGTPVIMLTGKASPIDRVKGKLVGCDAYLTKPVDHAKFEKVVQTYLQHGEHSALKSSNIPWQAIPSRLR